MSYDFTMLKLNPNTTVREVLDAMEKSHNAPNLFDSEGRQRSRAIANTIRTKNPDMDWQPYAHANYELIEISESGEDNLDGIQISIFPNEIGVSVPYWHEGEHARPVFLKIWDYLKIIQGITDYAIHDPQVGRIIQIDADFKLVLATYSGGTDYVDHMLTQLNGA